MTLIVWISEEFAPSGDADNDREDDQPCRGRKHKRHQRANSDHASRGNGQLLRPPDPVGEWPDPQQHTNPMISVIDEFTDSSRWAPA